MPKLATFIERISFSERHVRRAAAGYDLNELKNYNINRRDHKKHYRLKPNMKIIIYEAQGQHLIGQDSNMIMLRVKLGVWEILRLPGVDLGWIRLGLSLPG